MFGLKRKPLPRGQPSPKSAWHAAPQGFDTVVFVHGILGSHTTTWGRFPELLSTDIDLPRLDLFCWGYSTGYVPGSYQDVKTEGHALLSELQTHVRDGNDIYLLGHSMGGLVILKGLVDRILDEKGQQPPVSQVRWIALYASPLFGSAVANVIAFALLLNRWVRLAAKVFPYKQLRDLRRGTFCDDLTRDVVRLIYRPSPQSLLVRRAIPVRACAGKQDILVSKESATGVFSDPDPMLFEGDHGTVKLPDHHEDSRYKVFKNDLEDCLKTSFAKLCQDALSAADLNDRYVAARRIDKQYGDMIELCTAKCFAGLELTDARRCEIALIVWRLGAKGQATPTQVMGRVIAEYNYRDDPRFENG